MASATVNVTAAAYVDVVAGSGLSGKLMVQNKTRKVKQEGLYVIAVKPASNPGATSTEGAFIGPMGYVVFDGETQIWCRSLAGEEDQEVEVVQVA